MKIKTRDNYIRDIKTEKDTDISINGECARCNECCTVNFPITNKELKIYKRMFTRKVENNYMKYIKESAKFDAFPIICPFSNYEDKSCMIYDLRPEICKAYHCNKELARKPFPKKIIDGKIRYMFECIPKKEIVDMFFEIVNSEK